MQYFDPQQIQRIIVISSTAVGDTLLATPAIRAVRERYPQSTIMAHFHRKNLELFANNPHIDGIIPFYGGYRRFFRTIRELRRHHFDLALIFHANDPPATAMAYLSGARFIVKLPNFTTPYRFLLSNQNQIWRWEDFSHGVETRIKVAELVGCNRCVTPMILPVSPEGDEVVERFLKENEVEPTDILVGFQVGASTKSRMWFPNRFIELGQKLAESSMPLKMILTGSPQEYLYCKTIVREIGPKAVVAAGKVLLKYVPSLIKRFKVLLTGDTGPMHMAIAVGTPVIGLFAVSDAKRSGPYYDLEKHIIIQKERTCEPCLSKKCHNPICMEQITVDEVYEALLRVMRRE